jgi:alkylation response protein AidB-like acyl-CoA dehydrogenase
MKNFRKEGDGFKIALATLDGGDWDRISGTGIGQELISCRLYAKERVQFGNRSVPTAISFKIADMQQS